MKLIPNRKILSLTGPDTIALLERTVTHNVANWAVEGDARYGSLLTPQGKIIADYLATRTEDGVLLDVHEDAAENLARRLKMFRLRSDVTIEPREDLQVLQSEAGSPDPRSGSIAPPLYDAWRCRRDMSDSYHDLRIAAGVPEWGSDYRAADVFPF